MGMTRRMLFMQDIPSTTINQKGLGERNAVKSILASYKSNQQLLTMDPSLLKAASWICMMLKKVQLFIFLFISEYTFY